MLELIGLIALIYIAFKFGGSILGFIAKGILFLVLLMIGLPLLVMFLQFLLAVSAAFWTALFVW